VKGEGLRRPRIGITFSPYAKPEEKQPYIEAVENCGAEVTVLFEAPPRPFSKRQLRGIGGILLAGGGDIDPFFYREPDLGLGRFVSRERDVYELALTRHALRVDIPLLAICRGIQTLVVSAGGTLYQDLRTGFGRRSRLLAAHRREKSRNEDLHEVVIEAGSRLTGIFDGAGRLETNSRHHQAAKDVLAPLRIVARATDGVVEAVESPDHGFVVGVQWHPEYRPIFGRMRPLFGAFVDAANGARALAGAGEAESG
jgi:putative glutamine amidotransferase